MEGNDRRPRAAARNSPEIKKQDDDPQDGRITNLGLHQTINEGLGNAKGHGSRWDITVSFWWEAG